MTNKWISVVTVLCLVLLMFTSRAIAQESQPNAPQAPMGSGFTYQGQLIRDGSPYTGACDFSFSLWDSLSNLTGQVGAASLASGVSVTNGYFYATVNSGGEFGVSAFTGQARWLAVLVKCTGDSEYTELTPRQELTATPYASYAPVSGNADTLDGQHSSAFAGASHNHWGASWSGSGTGLQLNGDVALSGTGLQAGIRGYASATDGYGLAGYNNSTYGAGAGVYGNSASFEGYGVWGETDGGYGVMGTANNTTGLNIGVSGLSLSPEGYGGYFSSYGVGLYSYGMGDYGIFGGNDNSNGSGVYGIATASDGWHYGVYGISESSTGSGYGVYGLSASTQGRGVQGSASALSGFTIGVYGSSASSAGTGVYGYVDATSGETYGVYGKTDSSQGYGVYGVNNASSYSCCSYAVVGENDSYFGVGVMGRSSNTGQAGGTAGVYGISDGYYGSGVKGVANNPDGAGVGVKGESVSPSGSGLSGVAHSTAGSAYGVAGESKSSVGRGVFGWASAFSGANYGVYGRTDSSTGYGVYGKATVGSGVNYGVYGESFSSQGYGGSFVNYYGGAGLFAQGNGLGNTKAALRSTNTAGGIASYFESYGGYPTSEFDQYGTGTVLDLQNGGDTTGAGGGDFIAGFSKDSSFDMQFRITSSGQGRSDVGWTTPAEDYADMLPAVEGLQPGDLLVIGPDGKLILSTEPYQTNIAGVYSTNPGFLGGQPVEGMATGEIPLALVGVVPIKVSAENGAIHPGDLLTASSTPGHAMLAIPITVNGITFYPSGVIVGKALGSLESGTGVIQALVTLQ